MIGLCFNCGTIVHLPKLRGEDCPICPRGQDYDTLVRITEKESNSTYDPHPLRHDGRRREETMNAQMTCIECGHKSEVETSNPAIVHMTIQCPQCRERERNLETMRGMIRDARKSVEHLPDGLPDEAITPKQRELQAKHGTPKAFAAGCILAVGEISPTEARRAVVKYLAEWNGTEGE